MWGVRGWAWGLCREKPGETILYYSKSSKGLVVRRLFSVALRVTGASSSVVHLIERIS